jgi:tight adherence protein C
MSIDQWLVLLEALRNIGIALLGLLTVVFFVTAAQRILVRRQAMARMSRYGVVRDDAHEAVVAPAGSAVSLLAPLGARVAHLMKRESLQEVRLELMRAGVDHRLTVEELLALRLLAVPVGIAVGLLLIPILGPAALVVAVLGGPIGYILPSAVLHQLAKERRQTIDRLLPDMVEVLAVSMEAGLSFDTSVEFLAERMENPLTIELRRFLADIRLGRTRTQAFDTMVDRTESGSLREFVAAVNQAEEIGTGLVRTLFAQVQSLRAGRRAYVEQRARRAPVMLIFPIILCIMPVLFFVIMGPVALRIMELFGE